MEFDTKRRRFAAPAMLVALATWLAVCGTAEAEAGPGRVTPTDLGTGTAPASTAMYVNNSGSIVGHTYDPSTGTTEPVGWHETTMIAMLAPANGERGRAFQVNDQHQVIGAVEVDGRSHGVLWDPVSDSASLIHPDALFSAAVDLNENGDVLLWYLAEGPEAQPAHHMAIWRHDQEVSIVGPTPSDARTRPVALNDRGEVALTRDGPEGEPDGAYHWFDGELTDIGSLGGGGTAAVAIDQHGRIAGTSLTADGDERAFIWADGTMQDLGTLGGPTSRVVTGPEAMSDAGHVIGTSLTADGDERAFIWADGTMQDLGTLGGDDVEPVAVNDLGEVAGHSLTGDGGQHAFFWDGDEMTDLGTLGGDVSHARALNEQGDVVGHSLTPTGEHHAVRWRVR